MELPPGATGFSAVILAGGTAARLGGADKASIEIDGRTLLVHALDALLDANEVVVVGHQVPTDRPVSFTRESPRFGGPVAGLYAGRDLLLRGSETLAVVAVDMPLLSAHTIRRLHEACAGHEGAVLTDPGGRRALAMVLRTAAVDAVRPGVEEVHGMALRTLLADLDLVDVAAVGGEHRDVDTWTDLRELADPGLRGDGPLSRLEP